MKSILFIFLVIQVSFADTSEIFEIANEIQHEFEENSILLSNLLKKTLDIGKDVRLLTSKSNGVVYKLNQSTDVAVYSMFNSETEKKANQGVSYSNAAEKLAENGAVTKRIEKIIDFYIKRQQVPDQEMHQNLLLVERKLGELSSLVKNVYNINWLYIVLMLISFGLVFLWKFIMTADKRHLL